MKNLTDFVNENLGVDDYLKSLHNGTSDKGRPFIFNKTGMSKQWIKAIEDALKIVPNSAKPEVIGNFATWKKATGRKITSQQNKSKYGVTVQASSITTPKNKVSQEILDRHFELSKKSKEDYDHLMELQKDLTLDWRFFPNASTFNVVSF